MTFASPQWNWLGMIVPIGVAYQDLLVLTRTPDGMREDDRLAVRFVPLVRSQ